MRRGPATRGDVEWSGPDYGEAMARVVRERASVVKERSVRGEAVLDSNAFWRGGDDLNARLYLAKGVVHDVKLDVTMKAVEFAREVLGCTLTEMMAQFGPGSTRTVPARRVEIEREARTDERPPYDVPRGWKHILERVATAQAAPDVALAFYVERGFPRNLRDLTLSGFELLDERLARELRDHFNSPWFAAHKRAAVVTPMRSASTGRVERIDVRAFKPLGKDKRKCVGKHRDDDGSPRGYGWCHEARRGELVVLLEGAADNLAAEAMLHEHFPRAVAVGAHSAGELSTWASWLVERGFKGRVVIVPHWDGASISADGAGQTSAAAAAQILFKAKTPVALFRWDTFGRALIPHGLNIRPHMEAGFDLADAVKLAAGASIAWPTLTSAFIQALESSNASR